MENDKRYDGCMDGWMVRCSLVLSEFDGRHNKLLHLTNSNLSLPLCFLGMP
jgi:hypothetical protein